MKCLTMVVMVGLMGGLLRFARPYLMKAAGVPEGMPGIEEIGAPKFSTDESDLMATVFKSAVRLFTGAAKRDELASELSDKLYGGRGDAATMSQLGIELVKPSGAAVDPAGLVKAAANPVGASGAEKSGAVAATALGAMASVVKVAGAANLPTENAEAKAGEASAKPKTDDLRMALLGRVGSKLLANPELTLVPVVLLGMLAVKGIRRRRTPEDDFILPELKIRGPAESEAYEMKHAVHALSNEEFELLVALIYQRQG